MKGLIDILGSGWKGYVGGVLLLIVGVGLGADFIGQEIGFDPLPDYDSTWEKVLEMFGLGLAALGIRHKLDK